MGRLPRAGTLSPQSKGGQAGQRKSRRGASRQRQEEPRPFLRPPCPCSVRAVSRRLQGLWRLESRPGPQELPGPLLQQCGRCTLIAAVRWSHGGSEQSTKSRL